jgi:hypothetical protein
MKIRLVSTFSDAGYNVYAKHFVESCKKYIDKNIELFIYKDNVSFDSPLNFTVLNLEQVCPNLVEFKNRNKDKTFKDYRWDAVRFSHKVYATVHATKGDIDYLIWLDSDTEIYNNISVQYFLKFLPKDSFVGYIGRDGASETGFLIFDMKHPAATEFFDRYQWYYDTDAVYTKAECHDAFIFDIVRKEFEDLGKIKSYNVSPVGANKGHFNAAFDGYMVHYKGDDKSQRDAKINKILKRKK